MKNLRNACAVLALVAAMGVSASAADLSISKSKLGSMGLSGMQSMSDQDGAAVRGKLAVAYGFSGSNVLGNKGGNGYLAVGNNVAGGASGSVSFAAYKVGCFTVAGIGGSFGGSVAFAH